MKQAAKIGDDLATMELVHSPIRHILMLIVLESFPTPALSHRFKRRLVDGVASHTPKAPP
ncbi:hypothetical protein [Paraburkholderia sediminicola]|uniref:hypothetical protein n=1 Tax=Paraburkholderia sediminicola TaxID=458836 RepID=UPI0038BCF0BF